MAWSKLKNIILLLLVLTNLFLLFFVFQREFQEGQMERRARESAISFLRERGIQAEEGQIPRTMDLVPQTVERDRAREEAIAVVLLGEQAAVESRGGEVYRYDSGKGEIQFHSDGAFSARFERGVFPLGENRERSCLEVLALLDFQGELLEETADSLTFRQLWRDVPLFTQQVTLVCREGSLTEMTGGRRLVGQPQADGSREPVTVPTALFDFYNGLKTLGDVCSRIDAITPGYVSAATLSGPIGLTPVWRITTDTGAYQLDLLTGELSRTV